MKKLIILMTLIALLSGCAPWVRTGGPFAASRQDLSLDLPDGWMRWNMETDDYLLITRDGLDLQYIVVEKIQADDQLKHTRKRLRKGMLPLEAAEVIQDNIASNPKVHGLEVKENKSVKIDGHSGFRTVFTCKDDNGLKLKGVFYGFMQGDALYGVKYLAAQRYYFDRDLKTFERVVASARLLKQ